MLCLIIVDQSSIPVLLSVSSSQASKELLHDSNKPTWVYCLPGLEDMAPRSAIRNEDAMHHEAITTSTAIDASVSCIACHNLDNYWPTTWMTPTMLEVVRPVPVLCWVTIQNYRATFCLNYSNQPGAEPGACLLHHVLIETGHVLHDGGLERVDIGVTASSDLPLPVAPQEIITGGWDQVMMEAKSVSSRLCSQPWGCWIANIGQDLRYD